MSLPRLIITGASGFVGRHLVQALRDDFTIFGIARRSQARSGIPAHPNVMWFQADVGERPQIAPVFREIADRGGAETVIHLAAHYDFTGVEDPEYWRTNVIGLRHVLESAAVTGVRHFVFSSSVLACRPPRPGRAITEENSAIEKSLTIRPSCRERSAFLALSVSVSTANSGTMTLTSR